VDSHPIIVEPVPENDPEFRWAPVIGPETTAFLDRIVPENSRLDIADAAIDVLGKGIPPNATDVGRTGLVIGYVQSGKTMSFEAVITLARDNGFPMVIVVAGIATNLLQQSTERLVRDLRLDELGRERKWLHVKNPTMRGGMLPAFRDALADWKDPNTPDQFRKTILVTVLKNHRRLGDLGALLTSLDLRGVPVLVIDDEADQASLNTAVAQGEESTTYSRLVELRAALPCHTYLQYTATPQAPLLISIIDVMSPAFVQVLDPGRDYVGGRTFFYDDRSLVRIIPVQDVPTTHNPLSEPPESLLDALRVFMIGVAAGIIVTQNTGNRSMLVHPSHRTAYHLEFYNWIRDIFHEWKRTLELPAEDPDRQQLLNDFEGAYQDLAATVGDAFPSCDEVHGVLSFAFRNTRVLEVNAREGPTTPVDWRNAYGWILVGGQAMDRGFTIEGLTVTYMPRGIGTGNADTIQQRARFFGYKGRYVGFCRAYLEQGTLMALRGYVDHEEFMRTQLIQFQHSGQPLDEWKRAFILSPALRPCRQQVIDSEYVRGFHANQWVWPRVGCASSDVVAANARIAEDFIGALTLEPDEGSEGRTQAQRHSVAHGVRLIAAMDDLLVHLRLMGPKDSQNNTGLMLQLSLALERDPNETCSVYVISPGERRRRSVNEEGEIGQLFQGAYPVQPVELRGSVYPGDSAVRPDDQVAIQIHTLDLDREKERVATGVRVVAVWVPARLGVSWIVQDQSIGVD